MIEVGHLVAPVVKLKEYFLLPNGEIVPPIPLQRTINGGVLIDSTYSETISINSAESFLSGMVGNSTVCPYLVLVTKCTPARPVASQLISSRV